MLIILLTGTATLSGMKTTIIVSPAYVREYKKAEKKFLYVRAGNLAA